MKLFAENGDFMVSNNTRDSFQTNFADWLKDRKFHDISLQNWCMSRTINNRMRPYVFISYSHKDKSILEKIVANFEKAKLPFWFDNRELLINSDRNYDEQIDEGIYSSFCFIAFTSKNYWESKYCPHELETALKRRFADNSQDEYTFRRFHEHIIIVELDNWQGSNPDKVRLMRQLNQPSIVYYGRGDLNNVNVTARNVTDELLMNVLLRWVISVNKTGDFSKIPDVPDFLSHLKQLSSLNYANSVEIRPELFPRVRVSYHVEDEENIKPVITYLEGKRNRSNILMYGEGGGGKTITLKHFSKYLLDNKIPAVYVNVNSLRFELNGTDYLLEYLREKIFGVKWWNVMQVYMQAVPDGNNSVVLLIDGINEIPTHYRRRFIQNCINKFPYPNVKFFLTSRFDFSDELLGDFEVIETIPPDAGVIDSYLENRDIYVEDNVRQILRTPMLLTIFLDTEKIKRDYPNVRLNTNPCTCGQILENFFALQIYARSNNNRNIAENFVLFEYFLPRIALQALKNDSMIVPSGEFWRCIDDIQNKSNQFEEYRKTQIRTRVNIGEFQHNNAEEVLPSLATEKFHILKPTEEHFIGSISDYEFTHQLWRDFFVACRIAEEMKSLKKNANSQKRNSKINSVLATIAFSEEILALVADLTRENNRKPYQPNPGEDWQFPSKKFPDERFPSAESLLSWWRNEVGSSAQTAVYNLLNIMKLGRGGNLARLDLSNLDLRLCRMNGCKFSEFWRDKLYSSNFNISFLDLNFFVNDGHSSKITALCTDGDNFIFSGDSSGDIRCFDTDSGNWIIHENFSPGDTVVDLSWDIRNELLAILYQNQLVIYATKGNNSIKRYYNKHRSKYYRYVRFSNESVEVSFNTEPLIFCSVVSEEVVTSEMAFDVPSRCAVWNPTARQIVRSHLLRLIEVDYFDEREQRWHRHPILQQKVQDKLEDLKLEKLKPTKSPNLLYQEPLGYIKLEDYNVDKKDRGVDCIRFNIDGSKFLVAAGFSLIEFDSSTLEKVNSRKFHAKIGACCYGKDGRIFVSVGNALNVLDKDFVEEMSVKGAKNSPIRFFLKSPNENFYYVLSQNGEIKQLDEEACVRRVRKIPAPSSFQWVRDKRTREYELVFLPHKNFSEGARFNFLTNLTQPLGWCYDTVDLMENFIDTDDTVIYVVGEDRSEILLINKQLNDKNSRILQENFSGVFIYGCSFSNLKGGSAKNNYNFLKANGGDV